VIVRLLRFVYVPRERLCLLLINIVIDANVGVRRQIYNQIDRTGQRNNFGLIIIILKSFFYSLIVDALRKQKKNRTFFIMKNYHSFKSL